MTWRRVMAVLTLGMTAACSSLQPVPVEFISDAKPAIVHISDGHRVVVVSNPRLSGDTVLGSSMGAPLVMPLRTVQRITTERFSHARTALLVGGLASLGAFMTYAVLTRGSGEMTMCNEYDPSIVNPLCDINR